MSQCPQPISLKARLGDRWSWCVGPEMGYGCRPFLNTHKSNYYILFCPPPHTEIMRYWAPGEQVLCFFLLIVQLFLKGLIQWLTHKGDAQLTVEWVSQWMEEKKDGEKRVLLFIFFPCFPFHLMALIFSYINIWIMKSPTQTGNCNQTISICPLQGKFQHIIIFKVNVKKV